MEISSRSTLLLIALTIYKAYFATRTLNRLFLSGYLSKILNLRVLHEGLLISEAAGSEAWVCGLSLAGIAGSNPVGDMDVSLVCVAR